MYTKTIAFRDFKGKARNQTVQFNLETREVFKLLVELNAIFKWRDSLQDEDPRDLSTEEVVDFFNNFEKILLEAWGEMDEDGTHFRKTGRYDFEESKLFAACMDMFVSDIQEVNKLLTDIMPKGMEDMVRKQAESLERMAGDSSNSEELQARIAELQAQLAEQMPKELGSTGPE